MAKQHRTYYDVRDGNRKATVRRIQQLPNGLWRVDYHGGLSDLCTTDPTPAILAGRFPVTR